jgi:hypothetical protein
MLSLFYRMDGSREARIRGEMIVLRDSDGQWSVVSDGWSNDTEASSDACALESCDTKFAALASFLG